MRKVHRVALAACLKAALQDLDPRFSPSSVAWARAFRSERRFTFFAPWPRGFGFLIVEPSATARDNYFTLDLAWIRDAQDLAPTDMGDELNIPEAAPWVHHTPSDVFSRDRWRLRIDDLWTGSTAHYRGSFDFSTTSSRYLEQLSQIHHLAGKEQEDAAFTLLQNCMTEEKSISEAQASAEVMKTLPLVLMAIVDAAIPALRRCDELASAGR